ncbi:hypothetical protein Tco_0163839 [Tanacetum coccineum]
MKKFKKKDTNPSVDTSLDHEEDDQEIDEPQSDINPIRSYKDSHSYSLTMTMRYANGSDVKTPSSNGHLSEEVYMEQPEGNNIPMLQDVKSYLGRSFAMKDLGDAAYILGIKIYRDSKSQGASTPAEKQRMQNIPYASAIGSIIISNTKDMYLCFVLNGGAVDWKSTKQSIFATSSTDAEYIAAFDASKEAVERNFISGLGIVSQQMKTP